MGDTGCEFVRPPDGRPIMLEVVVQVASAASLAARQAMHACAERFGSSLTPIDPSFPTDSCGYYVASVGVDVVTHVIEQLRRCEAVAAVYIKPTAESPEGRR